jgi:hypothetical protein
MRNAAPQVCQLSHPGFRMLGEPVFRLSEGQRVPSMVVQLENHDAVLPLRSVAREFNIDPEGPDGAMLVLIEQALEFVVALRLGDNLPSELNGGEASWKPTEQDCKLAASRVRRELVRCVFARIGQSVSIEGPLVPGWEDETANRALVRKAIDGAATQLDGTTAENVTARVVELGDELACIETMRRTLTRGMLSLQEKLLRVKASDVPSSRRDTLHQVQALTRRGLKEITARFDGVDVRLDDILAMLRDTSAAIGWLRRQRDWLFRANHAWEPVFTAWAGVTSHVDEFLWKVVERTYAFLAPRFMSFQEWTAREARPQALRAKVW